MDANRIKKYFSQKPHTVSTIIAVALACIGFAIIILLPGHFTPFGLALMFVGAILFLVLSLQIKDSELSEAAKEVQAKFKETFEEEFIYRDTRKLHQAELRGFRPKEPVYESSYLMSGEGLLTRRGGDGKFRSSMYQCVGILKEEDYIGFGVQNFSLIGDESPDATLLKLSYDELSHVALGEAVAQWHLTTMGVYDIDGNCILNVQMRADAQTDELVADINAKIKKVHDA